jgi:hypothetical protein
MTMRALDKPEPINRKNAADAGSPGRPESLALLPSRGAQERFQQLVKRWKKATEHLSSVARMAKHPAYREIIQMGEAAVPLLLAELKRDPDFWFAALREITQENPVPAQSAGKIEEMTQAWIEWGKARGLIR